MGIFTQETYVLSPSTAGSWGPCNADATACFNDDVHNHRHQTAERTRPPLFNQDTRSTPAVRQGSGVPTATLVKVAVAS